MGDRESYNESMGKRPEADIKMHLETNSLEMLKHTKPPVML